MGCRVMQRPFIFLVRQSHKKEGPMNGPSLVREFCLPVGRNQREFVGLVGCFYNLYSFFFSG